MSFTRRISWVVVVLGMLAGWVCTKADTAAPTPNVKVIDFSRGHWDSSAWTPVRLANDPAPRGFVQQADSIATTMTNTFSESDYGAERDNSILIHDTAPDTAAGGGGDDVQVELAFTIGKGFHGFSAPGLCVSPQIKDGVVVQSIAVFVADYTMAIWLQQTDGKIVRYRHLAQLARWNDPGKPHTLRCRVSQPQASVAVQIDDADPIVLSFVGNSSLSFVPFKLNSVVGVWGCHGVCEFQRMRIVKPGILPFIVQTPPPDGSRN